MNRLFSLPINSKLNLQQTDQFISEVSEVKGYVHDLYFTCRMPPFTQDAMGDIFEEKDFVQVAFNAMTIGKTLGIPVSATFNNIHISPKQENLNTFIEYFKPLYDMGVTTVTIPHSLWMAGGQLKKAFPKLTVKNTIIRDVHTPSEVVYLGKVGFDLVNLDRDLMRDKDTLLKIKEARDFVRKVYNPDFKVSLLVNEGCVGECPVMDEHFTFNSTRVADDVPYFFDTISKNSCPKWETEDPSHSLKIANLSPWKEDWDEYINELGIDVFKLHGREDLRRQFESIELIKRFKDNETFVFKDFESYIGESNLENKPIKVWRDKIRNCKFDCWKCHYCDDVSNAKREDEFYTTHPYAEHVKSSLIEAFEFDGVMNDIVGLTSEKVKFLLNKIGSMPDARYLEIGSFQGATLCSTLQDNSMSAIAVDDWSSEKIEPLRDVDGWESEEELPKDVFIKNVERYAKNSNVTVMNGRMEELNVEEFPFKPNIIFYDGPHSYTDQYHIFEKLDAMIDDVFIWITDDYNWRQVEDAVSRAYTDMKYEVIYDKKIFTKGEDPEDFWNGLRVSVLRKSIKLNNT